MVACFSPNTILNSYLTQRQRHHALGRKRSQIIDESGFF